MKLKMKVCCWLSFAVIVFTAIGVKGKSTPGRGFGVTKEGREEELGRIWEYELIDVTYCDESSLLTFDAFGEKYELELEVNSKLVANRVRHSGIGIPSDSLGYISSLTSSCHYYVKSVAIAINGNEVDSYRSGGALSMCDKRGLRAHFWYGNESWTIKPANYYLGDLDENIHYDMVDKHMIYKESNYNTTGFPQYKQKGINIDNKLHTQGSGRTRASGRANNKVDGKQQHHKLGKTSKTRKTSKKSSKDVKLHNRKLHAYNSGNNYIEMGMICDPGMYSTFLSSYGSSSYYDELLAYTMDYVNQMSSEYANTDWGSDIGDIYIIFVEFEVFSSFSGNYGILEPDAYSSSCTSFSSGCEVDAESYVYAMQDYVYYYKDTTNVDNFQLFTGYDLGDDTSGIAFTGVMCRSPTYSVSVNWNCCGEAWFSKTIKHELGHNLGMPHDQDTTCGNDDGIMGYGNGYDFSSCSVAAINLHFDTYSSYMDCLEDTGDTFDSSSWNLDSVTCTTAVSSISGSNDDDTSSVSCPNGYTMTGCSAYTAWKSLDGSWISNDVCYARNGHEGNGVYAYARCCNLHASSCYDVSSSRSGSSDDDTAVAACSSDSDTLTGCTMNTAWKDMDGSYPGYNDVGRHQTGELISTSDVCTATNGHEGNGVYAQARCCTESDSDYSLQCKQIWGSQSGSGDDDASSVTCPSGYFLSGCNVMTYWREIDGAKASTSTSSETCYAYNGLDGNGVWAVAICCAQYTSNRRRLSGYENVYGSACDGYSCVRLSGIRNSDYNISNGEWIEHGCFHEMAYYRLEQEEDSIVYTGDNYKNASDVKEYYLYKSNYTGYWHIMTSLDNFDSIGFCSETNLVYCSGKWYFDNDGEWVQEHSSIVSICMDDSSDSSSDSSNSSSSSSVINTYGDKVCIFNDGSLWNNDIATFAFNGNFDGYPSFYFHYEEGNVSTIVYYLHFVYSEINNMERWTISQSMIQDTTGVAYCELDDLTDCVYGNWIILNTDSTYFDEITFDIDETMGYDANCGDSSDSNGNNNNGNYCERDNSCASWIGELNIKDSQYINVLCDDSFVECIIESLYSDLTMVNADMECSSDFEVFVNVNVSFRSALANDLYFSFLNNYQLFGKECAQNNESDVSNVESSIVSSNVTLCSNCNSFLNDNENETQDEAESNGIRMQLLLTKTIVVASGLLQLALWCL